MDNKWLGRTIVAPEHHEELERESAVHEFSNGVPREEAEATAYSKYKNKNHLEGAAHHLANLRLAVSSGEQRDADKHNVLYKMHVQALGLNPANPPPPEIADLANNPNGGTAYRFSNHPADGMLLGGPMGKKEREYLNVFPFDGSANSRDSSETMQKSDSFLGVHQNCGGDVHYTKAKTSGGGTQTSWQCNSCKQNVDQRALTSTVTDLNMYRQVQNAPPPLEAPPGWSASQALKDHMRSRLSVIPGGKIGKSERFSPWPIDSQVTSKTVPADWIGVIKSATLLKSRGTMNFYEVTWKTPEGKSIADFLSHEELTLRNTRR